VTAGSSALTGWTVTLTWPSGQSLNQVWNGVQNGTNQISNAAYNGNLTAGTSTTFGFIGNGSAATPTLGCAQG